MAGSGNAAAILLCAGKGTRMGRNDRNKVCCDCAGIPVVRRIVGNMRRGGIDRFVVVVGHMAESVMSALDGESGIIYAYQKEQKGTGHAAMCDLLNSTDGVYGSAVAGAGLGGCVLALVDRARADQIMERLNLEFYDRNSLPRSAFVCDPSEGSKVLY